MGGLNTLGSIKRAFERFEQSAISSRSLSEPTLEGLLEWFRLPGSWFSEGVIQRFTYPFISPGRAVTADHKVTGNLVPKGLAREAMIKTDLGH